MVLQKRFLLFTAIMLSLLSLLVWYALFNSPPSINFLTSESVSSSYELRQTLSEQIGEIGVDIEISNRLPYDRLQKLSAELTGILAKTCLGRPCMQYALVAASDGWFPCYNCGTETTVSLKKGEVWKYGKTCNGEHGRYSGGLPFDNLQFEVQFSGTEIQCLVMEKIKIYNYLVHPENIARAIENQTTPILRPAGNRIDR